MTTTSDTLTDIDQDFASIVGLEESTRDDSADHDMFSHYVKKEDIVASATTGKPVFALCGKKWTPRSNPEKYPVCKTCEEILHSLPE